MEPDEDQSDIEALRQARSEDTGERVTLEEYLGEDHE